MSKEISQPELQRRLHHQLLIILKAHCAILAGDEGLQPVGELSSALVETQAFDLAVEHLKGDPACASLIEQRHMAPPHDLEQLLQCPQDSLGYAYASSIKAQGFDPDLYSYLEIDSDASYVEARLGQTHDIWHIVTGFDTSPAGELGLQALHLAQFPYPLATMLIATGLMSGTLLAPEALPALLEALCRGWRMGSNAKSLFAQKWEAAWEKPLSQWRSDLGIQPIG
ncbi:Coq4 family protein [Gloeobacter violaceus]|uniref:Gll1416 protein n=1 Tax=Gloeobacter violaceus (strain ATCC 29082 / PCC 7421) TaxID=251221 RepID=Q7NKR1_GLOVI|nr:Coq4 family protein [Gloeobacter violaceus]BAC89357.1 gll1416 [Gloeobacter violaceus PCC 7421]